VASAHEAERFTGQHVARRVPGRRRLVSGDGLCNVASFASRSGLLMTAAIAVIIHRAAARLEMIIAMTTSGIVLREVPALTPMLLDPATLLCVTLRSRVGFEF